MNDRGGTGVAAPARKSFQPETFQKVVTFPVGEPLPDSALTVFSPLQPTLQRTVYTVARQRDVQPAVQRRAAAQRGHSPLAAQTA